LIRREEKSLPGWQTLANAGAQLLPEAGATQESIGKQSGAGLC